MNADYTYFFVSRFFRQIIDGFGIDRREVLRKAGLPDDFWDRHTTVITRINMIGFSEVLASYLPQRNLIMKTVALCPDLNFNTIFYTWRFAPDGFTVVKDLVKYHELVSTLPCHLDLDDDYATITFQMSQSNDCFSRLNFTRFVFLVRFLRDNLDTNLLPTTATVAFDPASEPDLMGYLGIDLVRGPCNSITFRRADLVSQIPNAEPAIYANICLELDHRLRIAMSHGFVAAKIKDMFWLNFGRNSPSLQDVTADMGIGTRKLQRQLADENTSYSALLDASRNKRVNYLLRSSKMSKGQIAYDVGFRDTNSLYRAMAKW